MGFVMCGCFENCVGVLVIRDTCSYCVLYWLFYVHLLLA